MPSFPRWPFTVPTLSLCSCWSLYLKHCPHLPVATCVNIAHLQDHFKWHLTQAALLLLMTWKPPEYWVCVLPPIPNALTLCRIPPPGPGWTQLLCKFLTGSSPDLTHSVQSSQHPTLCRSLKSKLKDSAGPCHDSNSPAGTWEAPETCVEFKSIKLNLRA